MADPNSSPSPTQPMQIVEEASSKDANIQLLIDDIHRAKTERQLLENAKQLPKNLGGIPLNRIQWLRRKINDFLRRPMDKSNRSESESSRIQALYCLFACGKEFGLDIPVEYDEEIWTPGSEKAKQRTTSMTNSLLSQKRKSKRMRFGRRLLMVNMVNMSPFFGMGTYTDTMGHTVPPLIISQFEAIPTNVPIKKGGPKEGKRKQSQSQRTASVVK